ncbi:DMT family transporter [Aeropyrum camini]|uniref:Permease of the drug/metabolite transporter superfamily n=1 Tax=Aeropyrum camini SY1 = JCM 12091 TaxID=1198449 RepID=U3TAS2_9CREN|nr:DMT family transporter [Aeropyrum camini]BAN89526.1 permease of the drug/metabolite transporter superfamily [Aeropyrum camini SY1 = JCM 12091]
MDKVSPGFLGVAAALAAALSWSTIGVVQRLAESMGADTDMLIVGRTLGGSLLAGLLLMLYRARPTRRSLVVAMLGLAPLYYTYMKSVSIVGAAVASLLLYTAPAWVALLGMLLLGERPGSKGVGAIALGLAGAALVSLGGEGGIGGLRIPGLLLGVASGFFYALYIVMARLFQSRGAGVMEVSLAPIALTGPLLGITIRPSLPPNAVEVTASLYFAVFTMVAPYMLNVYALRRIEAHRVSVVSLVEPLSAVVLATIVLGEDLTLLQALGGALIIAAALAASFK